MKKMRKFATVITSLAVLLILGSGTAMAAEIDNDIGAQAAYLLDAGEDELDLVTDFDNDGIPDKLRELNPDITDEQWEVYKIINNIEENGLVEVDEAIVTDGDVTIVQKSLSNAVMMYDGFTGKNRYFAFTIIYLNNKRIWDIYLSAEIAWNSDPNIRSVDVVEGSVDGFDLQYNKEEQYPNKLGGYPDHYKVTYNFQNCVYVYYELTLKMDSQNKKDYLAEMKVNYYGEQVVGQDTKKIYD